MDYPEWLLGDQNYLEGVAKFLSNFYRHPVDRYAFVLVQTKDQDAYCMLYLRSAFKIAKENADMNMIINSTEVHIYAVAYTGNWLFDGGFTL